MGGISCSECITIIIPIFICILYFLAKLGQKSPESHYPSQNEKAQNGNKIVQIMLVH